MDVESALRRILKTGKTEFGSKKALGYVEQGKAKAVVVASNCPKGIKDDILHYAKLSETPVVNFEGTAMQLGEVCGKPFLISVLTVLDSGSVKIDEMMK